MILLGFPIALTSWCSHDLCRKRASGPGIDRFAFRRIFGVRPEETVVLNMLPQDQLDLILRRHAEILARLAGAPEPAAFVALSRELAGIENVARAIRDFRGQAEEAAGLEALLADPATGAEMRGLAEEELRAVRARLFDLQQDLKIALLPKDAADEKNAILEIRAGTGGSTSLPFHRSTSRSFSNWPVVNISSPTTMLLLSATAAPARRMRA